MPEVGADALRLMTLRSDSQFNTTIYGLDDRFRNIKGNRMIVLMNPRDMAARSIREGDCVTLETIASDGVDRRVENMTVVPYDIPQGSLGGYFPECNPLLPLWHHAKGSKVPGAKSIPVRMALQTVDEKGAARTMHAIPS